MPKFGRLRLRFGLRRSKRFFRPGAWARVGVTKKGGRLAAFLFERSSLGSPFTGYARSLARAN